jgi:NADPH:quinone reductase-like Zn-dependent oxidoreductase
MCLTELGAWQTVNYAEPPDWQDAFMDISEDHGVDHVVAVGGSGTLQRSIAETRMTNTIGVIGT